MKSPKIRIPGPDILAKTTLTYVWILGIVFIVDIGMMIVSIMAYTGAQSEDDRPIIKRTHITFPKYGHHIQRTEIAVASLGVVVHPTLIAIVMACVSRVSADFTHAHISCARVGIIAYSMSWHVISLGAWLTCIMFQARYVPILGTNKLSECVKFGDELAQCGMVTASWIVAMVYCPFHLLFLIILSVILYHLPWTKADDHGSTLMDAHFSAPTEIQNTTSNTNRYSTVN